MSERPTARDDLADHGLVGTGVADGSGPAGDVPRADKVRRRGRDGMAGGIRRVLDSGASGQGAAGKGVADSDTPDPVVARARAERRAAKRAAGVAAVLTRGRTRGDAAAEVGDAVGDTVGRPGRAGTAAARGRRMQGDLGALHAFRSAPSPLLPLHDLAATPCAACGGLDTQVGRYPAYRSAVFAGRLLQQCRGCGLAWVPGAPPDLDAWQADRPAEVPRTERRRGRGTDPAGAVAAARQSTRLRDRARIQAERLVPHGPFARALDLGAGDGLVPDLLGIGETWVAPMVPTGPQGAPVPATAATDRATTLAEAARGRAGGRFDLVLAPHVLEHCDAAGVAATLTAIRAALRPGGHLLAEVTAGADLLAAFAEGRRPPRARIEPQRLFFSALALARLVRQAGFAIVELGPCDWTAGHAPAPVLAEITGGAARLPDGPLTILARAP
jgi:hypothetical protein